jgi:hypothetical protein
MLSVSPVVKTHKKRRADSHHESTRPMNFSDQPSVPTQGLKDSSYRT